MTEGGKVLEDALGEWREAVDLCRYYADEAERIMQPMAMPQVHGAPPALASYAFGVTGETNTLSLTARGVWVCISPWNFPLAIFVGQVAAALATGNTVLAKPAEQTPGVAQVAVQLMHAAGVPADALQLLHGAGETVGAALVAQPGVAGVVFTGSTQVAKIINRALAAKDGAIVPLIAETGGINAMVVDSSALPEQVVDAVVQSAFRSAGQRCSALRLLCLQEDIADRVLEMLQLAMGELAVGNPARLATDVGPVIDAEAHAHLSRQVARLDGSARLLGRTPMDARWAATHIAPVAFEIGAVEDLQLNRNVPVHLLDELLRLTPEGIYLAGIKQTDSTVLVNGVAQTNERVSEFLRNAQSNSPWLDRMELVEIKAVMQPPAPGSREQRRLFEFALRVSIKQPGAPASAPAGAGSAPKPA